VDNSHDKPFFSTFMLVLGALFALFFAIIIIAGFLGGGTDSDPKLAAKLLDERTAPVGKVITDPSLLVKAPAPAAHVPLSGAQIVAQTCGACHRVGLLGAPQIGDKTAWSARKSDAGGLDGLVKNAIAGKNAMPPRGSNADLSDEEVKSAIQYMLGQAGL